MFWEIWVWFPMLDRCDKESDKVDNWKNNREYETVFERHFKEELVWIETDTKKKLVESLTEQDKSWIKDIDIEYFISTWWMIKDSTGHSDWIMLKNILEKNT